MEDTQTPSKEMPQKPPRKPSRLTVWWRYFWMWRSRARAAWALGILISASLAVIYLELPASDQQALAQAMQLMWQSLGNEGLTVLVKGILLVCALGSIALLLAPGYRHYRYLPLPSSKIAPVTIYVDTENFSVETTDTTSNEQMMRYLVKYVHSWLASLYENGRYADLLFFMDSVSVRERDSPLEETPTWTPPKRNWQYEALYRGGFKLVDSPLRPLGTANRIKEAADKEIVMHALERALIGPQAQTFIIVAEDGGYVPLIYRLMALGHMAQIWSPKGVIESYRLLESYFPTKFKAISLLEEASKPEISSTTPEQGQALPSQARTASDARQSEARKVKLGPVQRAELKAELRAELKRELKGELKGELKRELKGELKGELRAQATKGSKTEPGDDSTTEPKTEPKAEPK